MSEKSANLTVLKKSYSSSKATSTASVGSTDEETPVITKKSASLKILAPKNKVIRKGPKLT